MKEDQIRDLLAQNIQVLQHDLELIDKEAHIPNELGTRGFIDLLAKDRKGHWVLIELKRSKKASREAIHEILKYVEGVKSHLGVRDNEIRVIVASTEWAELIVPFSRFASETIISVKGLELQVTNDVKILSREVDPLPINQGRMLSNQHEISLYQSEENLRKGIASYSESCKQKGIENFILVQLQADDDFAEFASDCEARLIANGRGLDATDENLTALKVQFPYNRFMLYFVPELLTREHYLEIIKSNPESFDEICEVIEEMGEEEALGWLETSAMDTTPKPFRDYLEIGYAAKFKNKLLEDDRWQIEEIHRYGAFARNQQLADDIIISEICGEDGSTHQGFYRTFDLQDKADFETAISDIETCLQFNPVWETQITKILKDERKRSPSSTVDIRIYNPSTGLLTLFFTTSWDDGMKYIPSYSIHVTENGKNTRRYLGELVSINDNPVLPEKYLDVLKQFYNDDIGSLLYSVTWGGYEQRDTALLELIGLEYSSVKVEEHENGKRIFFRYQNGRWSEIDPIQKLYDQYSQYLERNQKFIQTINAKIEPRYRATITIDDNSNLRLKSMESEKTISLNKVHLAPPKNCDICHLPLGNEEYIADAQISFELTKGKMGWANFCADCALFHSEGFAWGKGQLYRKLEDGGYQMVAGGDETSNNQELD